MDNDDEILTLLRDLGTSPADKAALAHHLYAVALRQRETNPGVAKKHLDEAIDIFRQLASASDEAEARVIKKSLVGALQLRASLGA